jgi:hypothetical protein
MSTRVQVIDNLSGQVLFDCDIKEMETAYSKASEYEEMGLDVKVLAPGLTESLIASLGATKEEIDQYKLGLEEEINTHNDEFGDEFGCALCLPKK